MTGRRVALFGQKRFFESWQRRLPQRVQAQIGKLLDKGLCTLADEDDIAEAIVKSNELRPLELGYLHSISLEMNERWYRNCYNVACCKYHFQGVVTYSGSPTLWSAKPSKDFEWCQPGIVKAGEIRLLYVSDDLNLEASEEAIRNDMKTIQAGLQLMGPRVVMLDVQLANPLRDLTRRILKRMRDAT